jgi:hypothetical protein
MNIDTKVWARLPTDIYTYFFRKIYAGDKGVKQELIARFFTALYKECRRKGIKSEWDPSSYDKINLLMYNLNFNERRRTANTSAKHTKESPPAQDDRPTVAGASH